MATEPLYLADQIGFVQCLEVFGDDLTVVNAARVSFDKVSTSLTEGDKKLIAYLAKHEHTSPFFHPQVRFRLKMPIFVAREWFRHTIGFARNEVSRRYVDTAPECWIPGVEDVRQRDPKVKQGSKDTPVADAEEVQEMMRRQIHGAMETYEGLLEKGVAPEVARAVLPQSMYTEFIETGSLAAYARLCHLRLGADAQKEIRLYAGHISHFMEKAFPVSWKALQPLASQPLALQPMALQPLALQPLVPQEPSIASTS
jgi:thymidylate synthase (FAD)